MKTLLVCLLIFLVSGTTLAASVREIRKEPVRFAGGASEATVTGRIKGYQCIDYLVTAKAGQPLRVTFTPTNLSAYFNLLPPRSKDVALFVGSTSGNLFSGTLPADGVYTIRVYLMRNAARRNESSRYTLSVGLAGVETPVAAPFDRTLELQGVRFQVKATRAGSINTLTIIPSGLEISNVPIVRTIDGTVTNAEVADLNADGSPEIYVYVTSAGSGSYGSLVAYAANRRKSLSEIYLPPLEQDKSAAQGYQGHDEFAVLENVLGRRFPIYRENDINARPTGGMRQLQYKLVPGEAGWLLRVDKVMEY